MTARPVPLPCGPTPDPARVAAIAALDAAHAEAIDLLAILAENERERLADRLDAKLRRIEAAYARDLAKIDRDHPEREAHGGPARTALRPADADAHSPEETR